MNLTTSIPLLIIMIIIVIMSYFLSIAKKRKLKLMEKIIEQKNGNINSLYKKLEALGFEKKKLHERVIELEDMKGDAIQVKLRNEVTEVKIDFTKVEIVTFLAGVSILLERTKDPDDAKIYIALIEKINGFIDDMKE